MDLAELALEEADGGTVLPLRVLPGARRAGLKGLRRGRLAVAVQAPPEKGRANKAVLEYLARILDLGRSDLVLLSGEHARDKRVLVKGLTPAALRSRLEQAR